MINKPIIQETIVVEGKSDVNKLTQLVDANFIITNGSECNNQTLNLIKQAHNHCGVILFLDPDFVGEKIRKKINQVLPDAKHAFLKLSDMQPNKTKIGIAEATNEAILKALSNVITLSNTTTSLTLNEYNQLNINNKVIRQKICNHYQISYCNNKQLFKRLNMMGIKFKETSKINSTMKTINNNYQLYIAATPIGNMQEASFRLIETIKNMDILLCEDTRVTKKLVQLLNITKSLEYIKFDLFNEHDNDWVIDAIKQGKKVMLVSDAGYPTISDPGYKLVQKCIENKIAISVINGPCSLIHAIVASGFSSHEFIYLGFIGKTQNERVQKLEQYQNINNTFIIFESVHRIKNTLKDLYNVFGNQPICIAKELTKMNEEFYYSNLEDIQKLDFTLKGEFVIVINKKNNYINSQNINLDNEIINLLKQNIKVKTISTLVSNKYGLKAKDIYKKTLEILERGKNE